jgi:hypothetical protein
MRGNSHLFAHLTLDEFNHRGGGGRRYCHAAEDHFRAFLDTSVAKAAAQMFKELSVANGDDLLIALTDNGGLEAVAAGLHPMYGDMEATAATAATTTKTGASTTMVTYAGAAVKHNAGAARDLVGSDDDMPRQPLPAVLLTQMDLEVNCAAFGAPPCWLPGKYDYAGRVMRTFEVELNLGAARGFKLVRGVVRASMRDRHYLSPVSEDVAMELARGDVVQVQTFSGYWRDARILSVLEVQPDEHYVSVRTSYFSHYWQYNWQYKRVPRSMLRSRLSQQELQELARRREQQEREELRRAAQQQCRLRDTAEIHCSRAWDRGKTTITTQSQLVWRKLHDVVERFTAAATAAGTLEDVAWDVAAALAVQDGRLRALASQLSKLPATVAAHVPACSLATLPTPSFEERIHHYLACLEKDIKGVAFLGQAKLSTPNESDKQVLGLSHRARADAAWKPTVFMEHTHASVPVCFSLSLLRALNRPSG